jgi:hypothetical protein
MFGMQLLSQGLPRKSLIRQNQEANYQIKSENTITELEDAKLFRVHNRYPRKLTMDPNFPKHVCKQLRLISLYSYKHVWRLSMDFNFCHELTDQDKNQLAKVLKGTFAELKQFSFADCTMPRVTTQGYKQLANALSNLKSLEVLKLKLKLNRQPEQSFYYLAQNIKKIRHLTQLSIFFPAGDKVNARVITDLAQSILQHTTSLTVLSFSLFGCANHINEGISSFTTSLKQLSQLRELKLNFMTVVFLQQSITDIMGALQQLNQLTCLKLGLIAIPHLSDDDWQVIAQSIANLGNLTKLELDVDSYEVVLSLGKIAASLMQLPRLTSLRLNLSFYNSPYFTDNRWHDFAQSIAKLTQLSELDLNFAQCKAMSNLAINEVAYIIQSLRLKSLALDLSRLQKLSNSNLTVLAQAINRVTTLNKLTLNLAWNYNFDEVGITALIASIGSLQSLIELSLCFDGCAITTKNLGLLKEILSQLSNLTRVEIRLYACTQVTCIEVDDFVSSLKKLSQVSELTVQAPSFRKEA